MRAVVVPRWGGVASDDWYPWAASDLARDGIALDALDLPDPSEPRVDAWVDGVARALAEGSASDTVLIGHSVGCRAALRAVEQLPSGERLRGLLLVAGWWVVDEPWESILPWQALCHSASRVHEAAGRPVVLLSDDDPFTADWEANRDVWLTRLDAEVRIVTSRKHFNASQEPAVLAAIRDLVA